VDEATQQLLEEFMAEIQECRGRIERLERRVEELIRARQPERRLSP